MWPSDELTKSRKLPNGVFILVLVCNVTDRAVDAAALVPAVVRKRDGEGRGLGPATRGAFGFGAAAAVVRGQLRIVPVGITSGNEVAGRVREGRGEETSRAREQPSSNLALLMQCRSGARLERPT